MAWWSRVSRIAVPDRRVAASGMTRGLPLKGMNDSAPKQTCGTSAEGGERTLTMAASADHDRRMNSSLATLLTLVLIGATGPAVAMEGSGELRVHSMQDLQSAHIAAHVPIGDDFEAFLVRDLAAYFVGQGIAAPVVTYELLRDGPTQSGVSFPKFYVWVSVTGSSGSVVDGAARVAAIDRTHFEITDFVSREQIVTQPASLDLVVPAALVDMTVERARRS
jgi:hypothetical protein